ncbi:DNA sulfur modification protein DndB [Paenibacillus sp. UNC499MF]|uniref:DNA sulfur modification protein DndB n=1 Tax=Paenibacillus sp. UNC499MF TaxID=1502751 RepID=UPI00089F9166|nr:DNA sulfur modification protein DndB [Paenibacillus sp. UNC499MF]SEG07653.1 DNA-sulfur modification-associated [Paenibacillus sp. UNC499MF]
MIKERSELEQILEQSIEKIKYKRKNVEIINKKLSEHNIETGFFNKIAARPVLLTEISPFELCLLTMVLYQLEKTENLKADRYFTTDEIKETKTYNKTEAETIRLPVQLNNVIQIDHENFVTAVPIAIIVEWYHCNIVTYNFETQRSARYKRKQEDVIAVPDLNFKSVKDIAQHMLDGTYIPDMITLNVDSEADTPVVFDPKSGTLTIKEGADVSVLDGFHRLQGAARALAVNPELKQTIILSIRVFTAEIARKYFGQINTINPVRKERLEELKQENAAYVTVKQLQFNSDLKGRISSGAKISELAGHYTTSDTLAKAIDLTFAPGSLFEAREAGVYLTEFFNCLLGNYREDFHNKDSILRHPGMFVGYMALAHKLKEMKIPIPELTTALNEIKKREEEWRKILASGRNNSSSVNRLIQDHAEKLAYELYSNSEG